jgi:hypothetical protein
VWGGADVGEKKEKTPVRAPWHLHTGLQAAVPGPTEKKGVGAPKARALLWGGPNAKKYIKRKNREGDFFPPPPS